MAKNTKGHGSPNQYFAPVSEKRARTDKLINEYVLKFNEKIAKKIGENIGSYRDYKHDNLGYNIDKREAELISRTPKFATPQMEQTRRKLASPIGTFRELMRKTSEPEHLERKAKVLEMNPNAIFPEDQPLFKSIKASLDIGDVPKFDDNYNSQNELARDINRFVQKWSSYDQVEKLMDFYETQYGQIYDVWKSSNKMKSKFKEFKDFSQDFWTIFRQINKKHEYESDSLLMIMTSGNADYLYSNVSDTDVAEEKIRKLLEAHAGDIENMRPGRIPESAEVRTASDEARKRGRPKGSVNKSSQIADKKRLDEMDVSEILDLIPSGNMSYSNIGEFVELMETAGNVKEANKMWRKIEKNPELGVIRNKIGHIDKEMNIDDYRAYMEAKNQLGDNIDEIGVTVISALLKGIDLGGGFEDGGVYL